MTIPTFRKILFETAFSIIVCDGEIHDDELTAFKIMISNSIFFEDMDHESELQRLILEFKTKGTKTISELINRISEANFTEEQELFLIETIIKMAEADSKLDEAELNLISHIKEKLVIQDKDLILKFPRHLDLLMNLKQKSKSIFEQQISGTDFERLKDVFKPS